MQLSSLYFIVSRFQANMSKKGYDLSNPRCLEKIMKRLIVDLAENEELGGCVSNFLWERIWGGLTSRTPNWNAYVFFILLFYI